MKFLKDFTATLGLRLTHHETFNQHLTPKATLMYAPGNFRFRATYSAGFRAPGLDELYYHYFSVNRGKAQISFGNKDLKPEKSNYFSLNAEYRTQQIAVSITGYMNRINDMVVKQNVDVDDATRKMLLEEFPEMTQDQADKMVSYALYLCPYQERRRMDCIRAEYPSCCNHYRQLSSHMGQIWVECEPERTFAVQDLLYRQL